MSASTRAADQRLPAAHPFRHHLDAVAPSAAARRRWTPADGAMPALYLGHGAPPLFEDREWMAQLHAWAQALPVPTSILIVSAHWEAAPVSITGGEPTELVYDFAGFDPVYFDMRYDTPPARTLVDRVVATLSPDVAVHEHRTRGIDHGAWVPLKVMYPDADVPVAQLSLPTHEPEALLALGRRLRDLRDEGVLVIGSGFLTHGLPFLTPDNFHDNVVPGWSRDFDDWAADALARGDVDELARYRQQPSARYAHPTVEHYTPLFVALGAATDPEAVTTTIDGYAFGLSKRSIQLA